MARAASTAKIDRLPEELEFAYEHMRCSSNVRLNTVKPVSKVLNELPRMSYFGGTPIFGNGTDFIKKFYAYY